MGAFNKPILGEAAVIGFATSLLKGKEQIKSSGAPNSAQQQRQMLNAPRSVTGGLK